MLKWLGKVLTPAADANPVEPARPAPAAARRKKVEEKPLQAPRKILDDLNEDVGNALLARQAIINRQYRLVGYEFSLPDDASGKNRRGEQNGLSSDELLVRTIQKLGVEKLAKFRLLWLRVSDTFITGPLVESLPPTDTVLLFSIPDLATVPDKNVIARAEQLKLAGYRLALGNWANTPAQRVWLSLLDYVVIDATAHNPLEIDELARILSKEAPTVQLMACHLESIEEFEFCHQSRFYLFQGNFLTKRENWGRQPAMTTDRTRLCDLLNRLRNDEEINGIAKQLRFSPTLSYRLLRYINSPAMGLQSRVASIESSLVFLGREKLYRWLTLLLFNADDTQSTDGALLEQALIRGRMMELLAAEKLSRQSCDELFVVGMFSLLDVLMKLPISVALDPLQLPLASTAALIDDAGEYAAYLRLAVACEANDVDAMKKEAKALGRSVDQVNAAHVEALNWTQDALAPAAGDTPAG